jgi:hypothetical protein
VTDVLRKRNVIAVPEAELDTSQSLPPS